MFLRQAARAPFYRPFTRTVADFVPPTIKDKGFNAADLVSTRASQQEEIELTDENYWDHIDGNANAPVLVYCRSRNAKFESELLKAGVQTTHGKMKYHFFDGSKAPTVSQRLQLNPGDIGIVSRGLCFARLRNTRDENAVYAFINRHAWMMGV